jgi:hypothetical protein
MDQIIVIAWGSIEFLLCPLLFFFFSFPQIICRMENHLTYKNTKEITFHSPFDPINYRVITITNIFLRLAIIQHLQGSVSKGNLIISYLHFHFQLCTANLVVRCKFDCALQTSLCASNSIVHCKINCMLQNQMCVANSTVCCKINYVLHTQLCATNLIARRWYTTKSYFHNKF